MAEPTIQQTARPSYATVFTFLSIISPYLLVLLLLLNSIINSNIKGLIYLFGVIFLFFIVLLFQSSINVHSGEHTEVAHCKIFSSKMPYYSIPSFNSALFIFTFVYILIPMVVNNAMNLPFLCILLILFAIDSGIRSQNKCTTLIGILFGSVIGIVLAIMWYLIIKNNAPSLLYYDDLISNKVACSRPTKQQFKCSVYKNGQLLQSV
jgi:hypothetical protein